MPTESEKILWGGRPNPWRYNQLLLPLVPFGLFVIGFAAWIFSVRLPIDGVTWANIAMIAIALISGGGSIAIPYSQWRHAKGIRYAVTTERIMAFHKAKRRIDWVRKPRDIEFIQRVKHIDGTSSIYFFTQYDRPYRPRRRNGLVGIKDADRAEQALIELEAQWVEQQLSTAARR